MSLAFLSDEAKDDLVSLIDELIAAHLSVHLSIDRASPWLTVEEAASYLGTTPGAIYKRIKRGQLPANRPDGSRILLNRDEINELLDPDGERTYDSGTVINLWPREADTSGAVAPGGQS